MTPGAPVAEVAELVGVSTKTIQRLTDSGELAPTYGPHGELRVRLCDIRDLLAQMSPDGLATVATFPKLYTVAQAAERLGVSVKSVRRLVDAGELAAYQLTRSADGRRGSSIRIAESELRRFLEKAAL